MNWCSNEERCGGCCYQDISYEEEIKIKEEEIKSLFASIVVGELPFEGIISSPKKAAYRNKMEFSFGDQEKDGPLCLGLHQKRSFFNILNTEDCRLPHPDMGAILYSTREFFREKGVGYFHKKRHEGYLRHLLIRRGEKTGEILVSLVHNCPDFDKARGEKEGELAFTEESLLKAWCEVLLSLEKEGKLEGRFAGILHTKNESLADAVVNQGTEILYGKE